MAIGAKLVKGEFYQKGIGKTSKGFRGWLQQTIIPMCCECRTACAAVQQCIHAHSKFSHIAEAQEKQQTDYSSKVALARVMGLDVGKGYILAAATQKHSNSQIIFRSDNSQPCNTCKSINVIALVPLKKEQYSIALLLMIASPGNQPLADTPTT